MPCYLSDYGMTILFKVFIAMSNIACGVMIKIFTYLTFSNEFDSHFLLSC